MHTMNFPKGFIPLLFVFAFLMAGFALVQGLLTLYCTQELNLTDKQTYFINAIFIASIFTLPILGSTIINYFLGYLPSTLFSLAISIIGLYLLCFQTLAHFYIGLSFFIVGNAISLMNLYILLGRMLESRPEKRVGGFTISYTCMNLGAFISLMLSGLIMKAWGYQTSFLISAILLLLSLLTLLMNLRYYVLINQRAGEQPHSPSKQLCGILLLIILTFCVACFLYTMQYNPKILWIIGIITLILILRIWQKTPYSEHKKLKTFITITAFSLFFWALYALEPSLLTLFIKRNVNRNIDGFLIPSSDFYSLNPLFIIILGTFFSILWLKFDKHKFMALPYKFAIGIAFSGAAFLFLASSTYFANDNGLINSAWIIVAFALLSTGELFISPIGLSMIGNLSSKQHEGTLMSIWFVSNGIGSSLSGYLSDMTINPYHTTNPLITNSLYGYRFSEFALIALLLATVLALLAPKLVLKNVNNDYTY